MAGPLVGIVLGSKSDLFVGKKVAETLVEVGVPFEITVASAHRTPEDAVAYAKKAASRGLKVLIGIAGLSAALPGVLAAHTSLPVIGVPVSSGTLGGNDALLAVTQMPPGVPVGAVGIDALHVTTRSDRLAVRRGAGVRGAGRAGADGCTTARARTCVAGGRGRRGCGRHP